MIPMLGDWPKALVVPQFPQKDVRIELIPTEYLLASNAIFLGIQASRP